MRDFIVTDTILCMARKPGRSTPWTKERRQKAVDVILARIAQGESVRQICASKDLPDKSTFFRWTHQDEDLCDQYRRAKHQGVEAIYDDIRDCGDAMSRLGEAAESGTLPRDQVQGAVMAHRERFRVLTWVASKLAPKEYGDKQHVEHSGGVQQTRIIVSHSDEGGGDGSH